jgi:hypothetical protein
MKRSTVRREAHAVQGHAVFCTRSLLAAFLVLSVLAGCNSSGKYPVRGKVTDKQGQPIPGLEGSQIVFEGASTSSVGEIAADGSFTLFTDRPGDGVPPGEYQVYIPRRRIDPEREAPQAIGAKFETPQTSDLKATVEPKANHFDFQVDRAGRGGK